MEHSHFHDHDHDHDSGPRHAHPHEHEEAGASGHRHEHGLKWEPYGPARAQGSSSWSAPGRLWRYLVHAGPGGVCLTRWRLGTPEGDPRLRAALDNAFKVGAAGTLSQPDRLALARALAGDWEAGESGSEALAAFPAWAPGVER